MSENLKTGFLKTLWLIRDYLPDLIIAGGWAPYVYSRYYYRDSKKTVIFTKDIDIVVGKDIPVKGKTLDEVLVSAGLEAKPRSLDIPPVIIYEGKLDGCEVEIEFLTDLSGRGPEKVVKVQKNIHAQALRYVSMLTDSAITVAIDDIPVGGNMKTVDIRVPSPAAYVFNKGLIFPKRRESSKKAKDLYYIFSIISIRNSDIAKEVCVIRDMNRAHISWNKTLVKNLDLYFKSSSSMGVSLVTSQRSAGDFASLDNDQFGNYVFSVFREFTDKIMAR